MTYSTPLEGKLVNKVNGNINEISSISHANLNNSFYVQVQKDIAYVYCDNTASGIVLSIDVSDFSSPSIITSYSNSNLAQASSFKIVGNYLYINASGNFIILDISLPGSIVQLGILTDSKLDGGSLIRCLGINRNYAFLGGGNTNKNIHIIDITQPTNLFIVLSFGIQGSSVPSDIIIRNNIAYITYLSGDSNGLRIYNVSDVTSPTLLDSDLTFTSGYAIALKKNYLFIQDFSSSNIKIIDITDPSSISDVATYSGGSSYITTSNFSIVVAGNYLLTSSRDGDAMAIFDTTNPASITEVGGFTDTFSTNGIRNLVIYRNKIFTVANETDRLTILDFNTGLTSTSIDVGIVVADQIETTNSKFNTIVSDNCYFETINNTNLNVTGNFNSTSIILKETGGDLTETVTIQAPSILTSDYTLTLPDTAGTNGYSLTTNGSGILSWTQNITDPGGLNTQIQFNNSDVFAGSSNFTWNNTDTILNVTNINNNFKGGISEISSITNVLLDQIIDLQVQGDYVYACCYNSTDGTVLTIDASSYTIIDSYTHANLKYLTRIKVINNYIFVSGSDNFTIIDATDKYNLSVTGQIIDSDLGDGAAGPMMGFDVYGNHAYVGSDADGKIYFIDIKDYTDPLVSSTSVAAITDNVPVDIIVRNDIIYVSYDNTTDTTSTLRTYNMLGQTLGNTSAITNGFRIALKENYLFSTSKSSSNIDVYNVADPYSLTVDQTYSGGSSYLTSSNLGISISGNYLLMSSSSNDSIAIFDISDITNITEVSGYTDSTNLDGVRNLVVYRNKIFTVASDSDRLTVLDFNTGLSSSSLNAGTVVADKLESVYSTFDSVYGNDGNISKLKSDEINTDTIKLKTMSINDSNNIVIQSTSITTAVTMDDSMTGNISLFSDTLTAHSNFVFRFNSNLIKVSSVIMLSLYTYGNSDSLVLSITQKQTGYIDIRCTNPLNASVDTTSMDIQFLIM